MVLKIGHLENYVRNTWKILKCDAGRIEKISWTDRVRNEEVLCRVKEERNITHKINIRKDNWIGHILRRNCLLKHSIEGKIEVEVEVMERQ
jgi:hypothetical protein